MSTTAARLLLDRRVDRGVERVLVLHDFDVSGFSICGTLGTDSGRYTFKHKVPIVDIGLRLTDVEELDLLSEPFTANKNRALVAETLKRHGATQDEIEFLIQDSFGELHGERVELNAMTSDEFIAFIEDKLKEHGVSKIIPDDDILEQHARRMLERRIVVRKLDELLPGIRKRVEEADLPDDLHGLVEDQLKENPELPWDAAVAEIKPWHGAATFSRRLRLSRSRPGPPPPAQTPARDPLSTSAQDPLRCARVLRASAHLPLSCLSPRGSAYRTYSWRSGRAAMPSLFAPEADLRTVKTGGRPGVESVLRENNPIFEPFTPRPARGRC